MRMWSSDRPTSCLGMLSLFYRRRFPSHPRSDRATDFGSWIDFNFSATSTARTEPIKVGFHLCECGRATRAIARRQSHELVVAKLKQFIHLLLFL